MNDIEKDLESLCLAEPPEYLKDRVMINARCALTRRDRARKRTRTVLFAVAASLLVAFIGYLLFAFISPDNSDPHFFKAGQGGFSHPRAPIASTDSDLAAPNPTED